MAQKIIVEGYHTDRAVAPLSELIAGLREVEPALPESEAGRLLVSPPFELTSWLPDDAAARGREALEALGLRIVLREGPDDPSWWRERDSETQLERTPPPGLSADRVPEPAPAAHVTHAPHVPAEVPPPVPEGIWETWNEVVFHPSRFFASPLIRERIGNPFLFAVAVSVVGAVLGVPGNYVLLQGQGTTLAMELLRAVLATPFGVAVLVGISTVTLHVGARIFGARGDIGIAFRIVSYSMAVNVFWAVPMLGWSVPWFFYFIYSIAGLQGGYGLNPIRATSAALLPVIVFMSLIGLVATLVVLAIGASGLETWLQQMQQFEAP